MIDWPEFRYAQVLPGNRAETIAERHSRVRREYGDYVRRQYGIGVARGKRRWSADTSALMRLSGDDGVAFRSVAFNRVRNEPRVPVQVEASISEVVKKMILKERTPGVSSESEIPKEVPEERSAGGELRDDCAVTSSELKSEADEIEEIEKEEPPVEEGSVDFRKALEILVDPEETTWFGSVTSWFKKIWASGVPWMRTVEEAPKSSEVSGDLGEDLEDLAQDGPGQIDPQEARWRIIATKLYRECQDFFRNLIRDSLEWMITAVDWFIGRGQFGFIDNFGGFRK